VTRSARGQNARRPTAAALASSGFDELTLLHENTWCLRTAFGLRKFDWIVRRVGNDLVIRLVLSERVEVPPESLGLAPAK